MQKILITTDFSQAAKHALDYTAMLFHEKDVIIDLLYIFPVPVSSTRDGVAVAAIQPGIDSANDSINEELARTRSAYPDLQIEGRVITGNFLETLELETLSLKPSLVVIGTTDFGDLYIGGDDPLSALRTLQVPVLFVPVETPMLPIRNIAYACNYAFAGPRLPIQEMLRWVNFADARLWIVHSDKEPRGSDKKQVAGEEWLRNALAPLNPQYVWIQGNSVIRGVTDFVKDNAIDCLMVVPHRYGLWQNLFHHSHTKALARLIRIPVIAFREFTN